MGIDQADFANLSFLVFFHFREDIARLRNDR